MARIVFTTFLSIAAVMTFAGLGGCDAPVEKKQPSPAGQTITASEIAEFDTLRQQLLQGNRTEQTRLDAARILLSKTYPQAAELLCRLLYDAARPTTRVAVAQAISEESSPRTEFYDPLMDMLKSDLSNVQLAAAQALASFNDHKTVTSLIEIAENPKKPREMRLAVITAMRSCIQPESIESLIELLKDHDKVIRNTATESLEHLTGMESFGINYRRWRSWWDAREFQTKTQWLETLDQNLMRNQIELERKNALLAERLTQTLQDLFNSAPKNSKNDMIQQMLADALPEVRLLGVKLAMKLIDTDQTLPDQTVSRLMAMMYDSSAQVRQAAATVLADLNHPGSAKTLLNCLKTETYPEVRVAILEELGQLKKPLTLPAIIQSIASEDDQESAAAAQALTQLAQAHLIAQPAEISQATSALIARYESLLNNENSYALREALLTAMGSLAAPAAKTVLQNAVNSKSGAIRLAAIAGLEQYKDRSLAPIFAEKIHDSDRGVRLAAVKALTGANDRKYLETLIMMASPKVESDLAIRQAAAQAALEICRNADAGTLVTTLKLLRQQQQIDSSLKIELLQLYLKSLTNQETPRKLMVELDLADELVLNSQPNDAAVLLSQAVRLAKKLAQTSPVSPAEIWEKYIQLLIDTGAPETIKEIADQNDPKQRKVAIEHILSWIRSPAADKNLTATITVTDGTLTKLGEDLTDGQKKALRGKMLAAVKTQQVIDRQQVARLLTDYMGTDGVKSADALKQIKAMGDRALKPLLESLKNVIGGEKANPDQEKSIIMLIKQVAPQVGDYDPNEPAAQKITRINDWLKKL